jgi:hypothetical protein
MPTFKLAHIREQGQNMLLFPLDRSFDLKSDLEKSQIVRELEDRAHRAGLAGRAAAIWESGGRTYTLGPKAWAAFLHSVSIRHVLAGVNKSISW